MCFEAISRIPPKKIDRIYRISQDLVNRVKS
jgi:hypothetical protein